MAEVEDPQLLKRVLEEWRNHKMSTGMIRDILMYLDRAYVPKEKLEPVYARGMKLWMLKVLKNPRLKERIINQVVSSIRRERLGEDVDRMTIRRLTQMYIEISKEAYVEDLESRLLTDANFFFNSSSQSFLGVNSVPDYIKKANEWIEEEKKRVDSYLDPSSKFKLLEVVYEQVLVVHLDALSDQTSCDAMMKDEKWSDLGNMYKAFTNISAGLPKIPHVLKDYAMREGMAFIKDPAKTAGAVIYIEGLLAMKAKYTSLVDEHFVKDKLFTQVMRR